MISIRVPYLQGWGFALILLLISHDVIVVAERIEASRKGHHGIGGDSTPSEAESVETAVETASVEATNPTLSHHYHRGAGSLSLLSAARMSAGITAARGRHPATHRNLPTVHQGLLLDMKDASSKATPLVPDFPDPTVGLGHGPPDDGKQIELTRSDLAAFSTAKEDYLATYYKNSALKSDDQLTIIDGDFLTAWSPQEKSFDDA